MTGTGRNPATADVSDAYPGAARMVHLPMRDFGGRTCFSGPIRTAVAVEDTKLIKDKLFTFKGNGGVIVLDGGGSLRTALLGDQMAEKLRANGWAGIVINGAVRDGAELAQVDIGIKALGTCPVRPNQTGQGAIDVPVAFGGVLFRTGDFIYCDADGVLVAEKPLGA